MAIKDSVISQVLKSEATLSSSRALYKRLRNHSEPTAEDKTEHKPGTNRVQTEHKLNTIEAKNRTQTEHNLESFVLIEHKPHTELNTKPDTNRTQTEHKPNTPITYSSLVGLQRYTLLFLYQESRATRSRTTRELSLLHVSQSLNVRLGSVKTTLARLEQKRFIKRVTFKNGRGGWSQYELTDTIYNELLQLETEHKLNTNRTQNGHKMDTELNTELNTTPPSSSSNFNYKNTTTDELAAEYEEVNFNALSHIGFTRSHLLQIVRRTDLPPQLIQDSIDAFAFDLEKNNKHQSFKKSPLEVFMGIIGKGMVYNAPENYQTPKQLNMKLYLEQKRIELENSRKLEEEALSVAFEEWKKAGQNQCLVEDLILQLEPMIRKNNSAVDGMLYSYYKENVWVEEKEEYLKDFK